MKDYSNLIPTSYGFVTKYEIVGDEIHIYTAESKKGEPHKYPLSDEWLSKIEKRLENQYQLIIENRAIVRKFKIKSFVKKIAPIMFIGGIVSIAAAVVCIIANTWLAIPAVCIAITMLFGKKMAIKKYAQKLDEELDIIECYLQHKEEIETLSQVDKNITAYLSKSAVKRLNTNQSLKDNGTIEKALNADFMDKTADKDLRTMLDRYAISQALLLEQTFVNPFETSNQKPKSKKRKK